MKLDGRFKDLLNYYCENYGDLSEDEVIDFNQSYDKGTRTRYTEIRAEQGDRQITVQHQKVERTEYIVVRIMDKTEVSNFFGYDNPDNLENLKKLLNIK